MIRRVFSSAGFSEPINDEIVNGVKATSNGIRSGPAVNDQHGWIEKIVDDAARRFESSLFIVGGWDWREANGRLLQRRDANLLENPGKEHLANQCGSILAVWEQSGRPLEACWIEIGNELDLSYWKKHLKEFHELAMACYERVRSISKEIPFITGSTANFDCRPLWKKGGYEILDELCRLDWPSDTIQGLHPYRTESRQNEWPTWDSSNEALEKLRDVLRGRDVAITEMGWRSRGKFSDAEIATFFRAELEMWDEFGAHCFVPYQIQDAAKPNNSGEGGFGVYTNLVDGFEPKLVAGVLGEWLAPKAG